TSAPAWAGRDGSCRDRFADWSLPGSSNAAARPARPATGPSTHARSIGHEREAVWPARPEPATRSRDDSGGARPPQRSLGRYDPQARARVVLAEPRDAPEAVHGAGLVVEYVVRVVRARGAERE